MLFFAFQVVALLSSFALGAGGASVVGFNIFSSPNSTSCCAILQQELPGKVTLPIQGLYEDSGSAGYLPSNSQGKFSCKISSLERTQDVSTTLSVLVEQGCQFAVASHEQLPSPTIPSIQSPGTTSIANSTHLSDDAEESMLMKYRYSRGQRRRRTAVYNHIDAYNLTAVLQGAILSPGFQQKASPSKKFRFMMAPMRM